MEVINRQNFNFPKEEGGTGVVTGVLTEDAAGLFAVYVGNGSDDWIAACGNKLPLHKATFFFPSLTKKTYRR